MKMLTNATDLIGQLFNQGVTSWVGSYEAVLIIVFILLFVVCLAMQIPIEYVGVILLPLCIVTATESHKFFIPIVVFILYTSAIVAKNFLFK